MLAGERRGYRDLFDILSTRANSALRRLKARQVQWTTIQHSGAGRNTDTLPPGCRVLYAPSARSSSNSDSQSLTVHNIPQIRCCTEQTGWYTSHPPSTVHRIASHPTPQLQVRSLHGFCDVDMIQPFTNQSCHFRPCCPPPTNSSQRSLKSPRYEPIPSNRRGSPAMTKLPRVGDSRSTISRLDPTGSARRRLFCAQRSFTGPQCCSSLHMSILRARNN